MTDFAETNILWVCGGIDAYGSVIGHAVLETDDDKAHTIAEKAITSFRWSVRKQDFLDHFIPQKRDLTEDELVNVQDWLVRQGYAEDESFGV